jgi:hypothetical protein
MSHERMLKSERHLEWASPDFKDKSIGVTP